MKVFFAFFISIITAMELFSQTGSSDRNAVAAGRFYESSEPELRKDLENLFKICPKSYFAERVQAIISPHAGYVFSGSIAASAYSSIPSDAVYRNIFIIGSSHTMAFDGASVYHSGDYTTPLGKVKVNRQIAEKLRTDNLVFRYPETSHIQEHSIEVQLPFIQYHFARQPEIVPILIGTDNKSTIRQIAEALRPYFVSENLFVISSDFSHYPSYSDAKLVDGLTADALVTLDPDKFLKVLRNNSAKDINGLATSMCGWTSGLVLLYLVEGKEGYQLKKTAYLNSGDSKYGDKIQVVGYNSLVLLHPMRNNEKVQMPEVRFTADEIKKMFEIARNSIKTSFNTGEKAIVAPSGIPEALKQKMGAFVTLKINGNLRGCIGQFPTAMPLYEVINRMAFESAFNDTRFDPLTKAEYNKVDIEISVIGPLRRISDPSEIVLGKHGIYIKKDFRSGTMLPQVATENNWTLEQFLGYTSRDKAGLGWDGWKNADLSIYEAVVLEEKK
ncbi:MAG: AmmeMemoRadiSam system protein B [Bacteroidales bacterium]